MTRTERWELSQGLTAVVERDGYKVVARLEIAGNPRPTVYSEGEFLWLAKKHGWTQIEGGYLTLPASSAILVVRATRPARTEPTQES